jgi:hypothetical protein
MFYETSYNDGLGKTATEAEVKAAVAGCMPQWKAAGRPQRTDFCSTLSSGGGGLVAQPGHGITTLPAPGMPSATGGGLQTPPATDAGDDSGFDFAGMISGIPPTLLYVGGAIVVFMLLKKR